MYDHEILGSLLEVIKNGQVDDLMLEKLTNEAWELPCPKLSKFLLELSIVTSLPILGHSLDVHLI